jgi:hypothetical protein
MLIEVGHDALEGAGAVEHHHQAEPAGMGARPHDPHIALMPGAVVKGPGGDERGLGSGASRHTCRTRSGLELEEPAQVRIIGFGLKHRSTSELDASGKRFVFGDALRFNESAEKQAQ